MLTFPGRSPRKVQVIVEEIGQVRQTVQGQHDQQIRSTTDECEKWDACFPTLATSARCTHGSEVAIWAQIAAEQTSERHSETRTGTQHSRVHAR